MFLSLPGLPSLPSSKTHRATPVPHTGNGRVATLPGTCQRPPTDGDGFCHCLLWVSVLWEAAESGADALGLPRNATELLCPQVFTRVFPESPSLLATLLLSSGRSQIPSPTGRAPCVPLQSRASHAAAGRDLAAVPEPGHLWPWEAGDAWGADYSCFSMGDTLVLLAFLKAAHVCGREERTCGSDCPDPVLGVVVAGWPWGRRPPGSDHPPDPITPPSKPIIMTCPALCFGGLHPYIHEPIDSSSNHEEVGHYFTHFTKGKTAQTGSERFLDLSKGTWLGRGQSQDLNSDLSLESGVCPTGQSGFQREEKGTSWGWFPRFLVEARLGTLGRVGSWMLIEYGYDFPPLPWAGSV